MSDNNDYVILESDKPYVFRFGHKALKLMQKITNTSIQDFGTLDLGNLETLEKVVYCGLVSENKDLKLEDVEDILDKTKNYLVVLPQLIGQALSKAFGEDTAEETEEKK